MNTALTLIKARVAGESNAMFGTVTESDLKSARAIKVSSQTFRLVSSRVFHFLTKNGVSVYCVFDKRYYEAQFFVASRASDASSPASWNRDEHIEFGCVSVGANSNTDDVDVNDDGIPNFRFGHTKGDHQVNLSKLDVVGKAVVELAEKLDAFIESLPSVIELSPALALNRVPGKKVSSGYLVEYKKPGKAEIYIELEPAMKTRQLSGSDYMNVNGAQLKVYFEYPKAINKNGQVTKVDDGDVLSLNKQVTVESVIKLVMKLLKDSNIDLSRASESIFVYELDNAEQKVMVRDGLSFKKELTALISKYELTPVGKGSQRK